MPESSYSIAILAGGKNRRFGGEIKALRNFHNKPVMQHILEAVEPLSDDVFIITEYHEAFKQFNISLHQDIYKNKGPMGGLHAALTHAKYKWVFVLASDMPMLSRNETEYLNLHISNEFKAVMPREQNRVHPLHAFYHKSLLPEIASRLQHEESQSLRGFADGIAAKMVPVKNAASYININTPEELKRYEKKAHSED